MKKLVFTIQIIALIAFFPVYLVAELSREKIEVHTIKPASAIEETTEKKHAAVTPVDADGQKFILMIK